MTGLLIKHFLFDFPLQTQRMIEEKGIYLKEHGIGHSYLHGFGTAVVFVLAGIPFGIAGLAGFMDFTIHYHVDYWKSNLCRKFNLTPSDKWFWTAIGLDQLLHGLTYVALIHLVLNRVS